MVVITSSSSGYQAGQNLELSRRRPASLQAVGGMNLMGTPYGIRNQVPVATAQAGSYPIGKDNR
jgi:hypothetical protein